VELAKDTRYMDIHEGEELDEAQMATWVKQAPLLVIFLMAVVGSTAPL
jgi:hypothetical protein